MGAYASYSHFSPRSPPGSVSISLSRALWTGPDVPGHVRIVRITDRGQPGRRGAGRSTAARRGRFSFRSRAARSRSRSPSRRRSPRRPTGSRTPASSARRSRSTSDPPACEPAARRRTGPGLGAATLGGPGPRGDGPRRGGRPHRPDARAGGSGRPVRRVHLREPGEEPRRPRPLPLPRTSRSTRACSTRCCWRRPGSRTRWARPTRWRRGSPRPRWRSTAVPVYLWGRRLVPPVARPARGRADAPAAGVLLLGDPHDRGRVPAGVRPGHLRDRVHARAPDARSPSSAPSRRSDLP